MSEKPSLVEEIWVNVTEAAEITGYSRQYVLRLVSKIWQHMAEAERPVKLRKRSSGYDLWLPDLMNYVENIGHGPHRKPGEDEGTGN